jgi:hypothetical protein
LGITIMRFTIKDFCLLIGVEGITLAFGYWDDGVSFHEVTVICLSVYLWVKLKNVTLAIDR